MKALARPWLWLVALGALAGCTERPHEPVRVIAAPRAEAPALPPPVTAPPAPPPAAALPAASSVAAVVPRAPPPTPASAPLQRRYQPGEPNGNDAFRAALEDKLRARGTASAP